MKRRNLNPDPRAAMADLVARLNDRAAALETRPHGVKDLGESGDVVWPRPDGTAVSVRDVDLELADARQRIEGAETSLSETGTRLADAERAVSDAVASIDGKLDESALDAPETSERLATSMTDVARHLIVTDSAILNHATLIGQTVVDDINVQGKLIGKDGVFTGTVDFENINVTDQVLAERLAGEHIYGTVIEGGEIRTTDGLPGQVILSDEGYVDMGSQNKYPGIRIIPVDTSQLVTPPGIGPNSNGFVITGGRNLTGGRGFSIYSPNAATMSFEKGTTRSNVSVSDRLAWLGVGDGGGNSGEIAASPTSAWIGAGDGGGNKGEVLSTATMARVRTAAADGSYGVLEATPSGTVVATRGPGGSLMSQIRSNGREAYLRSNGTSESTFSSITSSPDGSELYATDGTQTARTTANLTMAQLQFSSASQISRLRANADEMYLWRRETAPDSSRTETILSVATGTIKIKSYEYNPSGTLVRNDWVSLGGTAWQQPWGIASGWSMPTSAVSGWEPMRARKVNGFVVITGVLSVASGGSFSSGTHMLTLASHYRPVRRYEDKDVRIDTDGRVTTRVSGSGALAFHAIYPYD